MKYLILILSIFLFSCDSKIIDNYDIKIKVTMIEEFNYRGVQQCKYYIPLIPGTTYFYDTCGKFQIGDELNIIKKN